MIRETKEFILSDRFLIGLITGMLISFGISVIIYYRPAKEKPEPETKIADCFIKAPSNPLGIPTERKVVITAYSSSPEETAGDPFITASGERVREGIVACPREYKFGTIIEIEGKSYICQDRLAKKYDDRIDIWMTDKNSAKTYGKQLKEVRVYR